jgi:hypothetical protein
MEILGENEEKIKKNKKERTKNLYEIMEGVNKYKILDEEKEKENEESHYFKLPPWVY